MRVSKSPIDALESVRSGHRVFLHGGAATPKTLERALIERAPELTDVEIVHLHTTGTADYAEPQYAKSFRVANLFVGPNMRARMDYDRVDFVPCFLSEIPRLFRSGRRPIDVALVHVSPPDRHGYCSLGTSVDVARAAVDSAAVVIAQINPRMPRTHGDGFLHVDRITAAIEADEALPTSKATVPSEEEVAIGHRVAELVEDGSTLQVGIGAVPDAVLAALSSRKHLGLHTEMFSDGALNLILSGAIDNSLKAVHRGKSVSAFVSGGQRLYDWLHDNPSVALLGADYVNDARNIARNPKVVAINSAVEIDLTGQVCADSVGPRLISGVGGQMDFIRGASLSPDGKPIIALTSRTKKGRSRLVPALQESAGVVTTRAHVHFVATEYGCLDLFGLTMGERAKALISLAHPDDRESLDRAWHDRVRRATGRAGSLESAQS